MTYDVPLDLGRYGSVEEEFCVSGRSAVYADDLSMLQEVPYTNRLIVRRPKDRATASGVVFVEILNPSNGYDAEGMWRRGWDYYLDQRHTYVGFSARPVTIDALKIFDPVRYAPLDAVGAWAVDQTPAADSMFFELGIDGQLARDADGNVRGGLRYGPIEHPVATFTGSPTGGTLGSVEPFEARRVPASWPTLTTYLDAVAAVDRALQERGYLNEVGFAQLQGVARDLWTRATGRQG